ncbi:hypothetical protein ACIQPP_08900 [Streptomyces violaceusniger]|uniref:hypothetical protein n=1 Tax=Streptomyces violaceusniger TaxID=68280 RepID=UPI0009C352CA|nr:peptidase M15D vanX D-ala-D-ala dipeptidase [Streptomyces hygroscopicus]
MSIGTAKPDVTVTVPAQTPARPGLPSPEPGWRVWPRRWPRWAPHVTAVWGVLYAAVQVVWAAAGTTVPWSPHVAYAPGVQLALAAGALLASGACLATPRPLARRGRVAVAAVLAVAVPVFAMGMASLPAYVVTLASLSGVESATGFAHVLLNTVGLGLLLLVGVSHRRRLRGRCPRCGAGHTGDGSGPLVHPPASVASRRTRIQVYLLMCGLLPWAVVKTIWTLGGDALSVTAEKWREENAGGSGVAKALVSVGIDVTVLAALAGIFLLLGLMYPWVQVFPRWTLLLTGRRVPRLLPLLPAWLSAIGLSVYGVVLVIYAPLSAADVLPRIAPDGAFTSSAGITWMVLFGGPAFGGLGFGLIAAARSYAARTRPVCAIAPTDAMPGN